MARAQGHGGGVQPGGVPAQPFFDPVNQANPGLFGQGTAKPKERRIELSNALTDHDIPTGASTFIWVVNASSPTASARATFDHDRSGSLTLKLGLFLSGFNFAQMNVTADAQAGQWIDIVTGNLPLPSAVNPSDAVSTFTTEPNDTVFVLNDNDLSAGSTQIFAAAANRKRALIQNVGNDSFRIRTGTAGTATTGFVLAPGQFIEFFNTSAIAVYCASQGCAVSAVEERTA